MTPQDEWGVIWYIVFGQTRSQIERDATSALLVFRPPDIALKGEDCDTTTSTTSVQNTTKLSDANVQSASNVAQSNFFASMPVTPHAVQPTPYVGSYFNQSMRLLKQLKTVEASLGVSSPQAIAKFQQLLSLHLHHLNHLEAESLIFRVLEAREKTLGQGHCLTVALLEYLGYWYQKQGKYQLASQVRQKLMLAYKKIVDVAGYEHESCLEQMARTYHEQGSYAEAEPLYSEVMQRIEAYPDHWTFKRDEKVRLLNRLARLYRDWKKYQSAEMVYRKLLVIHKSNDSHQQTPLHLNGLLSLLREQKEYQTPEKLTVRLVEIYTATLGREHSLSIHTMKNLAELYKSQMNYAVAEVAYIQLLNIQQKVLGLLHPDCIESLNSLKSIYLRVNDQKKIEDIYLRLLDRKKQTLGLSHPDVAQTINNLASLYAHQKRNDE